MAWSYAVSRLWGPLIPNGTLFDYPFVAGERERRYVEANWFTFSAITR